MTHKVQRRGVGGAEETVALQMTRTSSTDNLISDTNVDDAATCLQRSSNADGLLWLQFQKRLTTDQQERLRQVEQWRQTDEKFCPVVFGRRKSSITYLLQESSPITDETMVGTPGSIQQQLHDQNDEIDFIMNNFLESICKKFTPGSDNGMFCSVCGLHKRFHEVAEDETDSVADVTVVPEPVSVVETPIQPENVGDGLVTAAIVAAAVPVAVTCDLDTDDSRRPGPSQSDELSYGVEDDSFPEPAAADVPPSRRRLRLRSRATRVEPDGPQLALLMPQHVPSRDVSTSTPLTSRRVPTSFGDIAVPSRFIGTLRHRLRDSVNRKYLRFQPDIDSLWKLLTEVWKFPHPSLVLSVAGGQVAENYEVKYLQAALTNLVSGTNVWIVSDGRNYGASRCIGRMLAESRKITTSFYDSGSDDDDDWPTARCSDPVLIGVSHWGSLKRKKLLGGISLPEDKSSRYFHSMQYKLARDEHQRVLNPYQSAYLLLDNGLESSEDTDKAVNCVQKFRKKFDQCLAEMETLGNGATLPVVTLVLGGDGLKTIDHVKAAVESRRPVVIVKGSSRVPTLLAELFYVLEDKVPRAWKDTTEWNAKETKMFCQYITRFTSKIQEIFRITVQPSDSEEEIKQKEDTFNFVTDELKRIMEKRHYMTVIDSDLEIGQDLYSSFIQGIYKGYTRPNGLMIALKTCHQEFFEALINQSKSADDDDRHRLLTVSSLNSLHRQNFDQDSELVNVLKMVLKRQSSSEDPLASCQLSGNACSTGADSNCLQIVGRILYLLLGTRYKILYHDKPFVSLEDDPDRLRSKKSQMWHLLLWSVLSCKPAMTRFFVVHTKAPLGAALIAYKLYSRLAEWAENSYEGELSRRLQKAATDFQNVAIRMLDKMYSEDQVGSYRVLITELKFGLGPYITPLVIADDSRAMDFMSRGCCQTYLQMVWKGKMGVDTPAWKSFPIVFPFLCFILPWIHLYDSSVTTPPTAGNVNGVAGSPGSDVTTARQSQLLGHSPLKNPHKDKTKPKPKHKATDRIKYYFTAPVTKFYFSMMSYMAFLVVLSYFVVTELRPFTSLSSISVCEWILLVWFISHVIEELLQIFDIHITGPLYRLPYKSLRRTYWHRREMLRAFVYPVDVYFRNGRWNGIDIAIIAMFIVSFSLRFALPLNKFQVDRVLFAVTVIICYFRLLRFWFVLPSIGPRIIAIEMMLTELVKFLLVLVVFIISFGIAFQAILHPNQSPSWKTFADILWRPYWQMFGEVFLEDVKTGMGRDVSDTSCLAHMYDVRQQMHDNSTEVSCVEWAAPVLLGIYLLIANVLLLNLLIAIFSQAYEELKDMSHTVYYFNIYNLIQECYYQTTFPPPLSIIERLVSLVTYCVRGCQPAARVREDSFRLNWSEEAYELQKKALRAVPQYRRKQKHRRRH